MGFGWLPAQCRVAVKRAGTSIKLQVNRAQTETNGLYYCAPVLVLTPVTTEPTQCTADARGSRFKIINGSIT